MISSSQGVPMIRLLLRPVACTLAVAILLMLGATTGSAFAHEIQHAAHHNAGMHATGICAWMCATAGAIATVAFHATAVTVSGETAMPFLGGLWSFGCFAQLQARAPPVLLLITASSLVSRPSECIPASRVGRL